MKYAIGERVKVKSLEWYNTFKDKNGRVIGHPLMANFEPAMSRYCNMETIVMDYSQAKSCAEKYYILKNCPNVFFQEEFVTTSTSLGYSGIDVHGEKEIFNIGDKVEVIQSGRIEAIGYIVEMFREKCPLSHEITLKISVAKGGMNTIYPSTSIKKLNTFFSSSLVKGSDSKISSCNSPKEVVPEAVVLEYCGIDSYPIPSLIAKSNLIPQKQSTIKLKEEIYQKFELPKIVNFKLNQN
jgi:hypothetical protein